MLGIAGVRMEFMQGTSYKFAWEAIFLTFVPFLLGRFQSSAVRTFLSVNVRLVQHLIWNHERAQEHERQRMSSSVTKSEVNASANLVGTGWGKSFFLGYGVFRSLLKKSLSSQRVYSRQLSAFATWESVW
jgi:hypothetical protein